MPAKRRPRGASKALSANSPASTRFDPLNLWFVHPTHIDDPTGILEGIQPDVDDGRGRVKRQRPAQVRADPMAENLLKIESALAGHPEGVPIKSLDLSSGGRRVNARTVCKWLTPDGDREQPELTDRFEKFVGDDGANWIRPVPRPDADATARASP